MKLITAGTMATIFVVMFAAMTSASEAESGNELYKLLASESPYSRFVGQGYVLGVIDTTRSLNRVWRLPVRWTIPPEVTNAEIFEAVKDYLEQHPEERDQTAYTLVNTALGSAYPPKK
jgi:hypothetical protein